jgi:hypothetical protein
MTKLRNEGGSDGTNPFLTMAYLESRRRLGPEPVIVAEAGTEVVGLLHLGRLNRRLEIPSTPLDAPASWWQHLLTECRERKVGLLELDSFASPQGSLPVLHGETLRWTRTEYVIDLGMGDLLSRASSSHRQRIRLGSKSGLVLHRSREANDCRTHLELMGISMKRRADRGEGVGGLGEIRPFAVFLESGAGELFQARRSQDGCCLASMLLLRAPRGGYDQSSGSSEEGKRVGASHFLVHAVASTLESEGATVLNLGGAQSSEEGLQGFKRRFGAREVRVTSCRSDLRGPLLRLAAGIAARVSKQA